MRPQAIISVGYLIPRAAAQYTASAARASSGRPTCSWPQRWISARVSLLGDSVVSSLLLICWNRSSLCGAETHNCSKAHRHECKCRVGHRGTGQHGTNEPQRLFGADVSCHAAASGQKAKDNRKRRRHLVGALPHLQRQLWVLHQLPLQMVVGRGVWPPPIHPPLIHPAATYLGNVAEVNVGAKSDEGRR